MLREHMPMLVLLFSLLHFSHGWMIPCRARPTTLSRTGFHTAASRQAGMHSTMMLEEDQPPPEVIEAEANATPNRKFRLAGTAIGVALSAGSGIASGATLAGQIDANDALSALVLFDNPTLSLAVDLIIGGTCAWAWQQEQRTKQQNTRRIWEEVKRRRAGGAVTGPGGNRSQRRAKKVAVQQPLPGSPVGFGGGGGGPTSGARKKPSPPASKSASVAPPPPAPAAAEVGAPPPEYGNGLLGKAQDFLEEANAMGKAQALVLNAQLEESGVLPATSSGATPQGAAEPAAAEAAPVEESGGDSAGSKGPRKEKKRASKGKGGAKRKKGKKR
jgi:hypothetical protein